jgi:hypothetical protein
LTSLRSLKDENTQNRVFMLCTVITQIKGIIGKSPQINIKHGYNIVYDAKYMGICINKLESSCMFFTCINVVFFEAYSLACS